MGKDNEKDANKGESSSFDMNGKEESIYDVYNKEDVGHYVVITNNGHVSAGNLVRIIDDVALLNPFQGMDYSGKHPKYVLFRGQRHQKAPLPLTAKVVPITETSMIEFIAYENAQLKEKRDKEAKESKKKSL